MCIYIYIYWCCIISIWYLIANAYIDNVRCMPKPFVNYESVEIKSISIRLQYFKAIITVNNNNHSIIQEMQGKLVFYFIFFGGGTLQSDIHCNTELPSCYVFFKPTGQRKMVFVCPYTCRM